ncbi:hypothetical protein [Paenibacillus sp. BT-177]|uniref:hypothetical protein n=1 Tax=Paenibacillus sp. BT-177 TaxID=2986930 RepID=UPI0021F7CB9C|nr:hypothetical protein [Paenibacillus sp. BT-177]
MKDWVNLITAIIQLATALAVLHVHNASRKKTKKRNQTTRWAQTLRIPLEVAASIALSPPNHNITV